MQSSGATRSSLPTPPRPPASSDMLDATSLRHLGPCPTVRVPTPALVEIRLMASSPQSVRCNRLTGIGRLTC